MRKPEDPGLLPFLRRFFEVHLKAEQGASLHTIRAYRDAWRMFVAYQIEVAGTGQAAELKLQDVDRRRVLDFLHYLEETRKVSVRTRNHRLAAIRAFALFVRAERPEWQAHFNRILSIPQKRHRRTVVDYLEADELHCLLSQVRARTSSGLRDFTLLVYAYNTGARAQEIADTDLSWLQLEHEPFEVRLWGKGQRQRVVPLWPATVMLLRRYMREARPRAASDQRRSLFLNRRGHRLTRFGVNKLFRRYLAQARLVMPSLKPKKLSIHAMRHTTAVHLLQFGCELNVIKAWLGHSSISSTEIYTDINLQTKRNLLDKFVTPYYVTQFLDEPQPRADDSLDWMDRL